jgi:hypothetical protein
MERTFPLKLASSIKLFLVKHKARSKPQTYRNGLKFCIHSFNFSEISRSVFLRSQNYAGSEERILVSVSTIAARSTISSLLAIGHLLAHIFNPCIRVSKFGSRGCPVARYTASLNRSAS